MQEGIWSIVLREIWENIDYMNLAVSIISVILIYFMKLPEWTICLPYLLILILSTIRLYWKAKAVRSEKHLPMIFVGEETLNPEQSLEQAKDAIEEHFKFRRFDILEEYFHVRLWRAIYQRRLPSSREEWADYLEDGIERMVLVYDKVSGRRTYHLFVHRPSVIALGLGAILGRWEKLPLVIYQWMGDRYEPVLDLSREHRRIKEVIDFDKEELGYIKVSIPEKPEKKIAVALEMASHVIREDVIKYVSNMGLTRENVIVVENRYGGYLREKDWTRPVQELYNLIRKLKERGVEEIHLFMAMPEAMAFGLGYALGSYWDIKVYNFSKGTYELVFSLNELPAPEVV
jgi:hypothetical protein